MQRHNTFYTAFPLSTPTKYTLINTGIGSSGIGSLLENYYYRLADATTCIFQLLVSFSQGEFVNIAKILTLKKYTELSLLLQDLELDKNIYPEYEQIRQTIVKSLEGLFQSVNLYVTLKDTQDKLAAAKKQADILTDIDKLKEYLQGLKKTNNIFPDQIAKTTVGATLKPQYAEYIRLYGFPKGGVFDSEKLANIVKKLNNIVQIYEEPCHNKK